MPDNICEVCGRPGQGSPAEYRTTLQLHHETSHLCSHCEGPSVIKTKFRPIPSFVLWPDSYGWVQQHG